MVSRFKPVLAKVRSVNCNCVLNSLTIYCHHTAVTSLQAQHCFPSLFKINYFGHFNCSFYVLN